MSLLTALNVFASGYTNATRITSSSDMNELAEFERQVAQHYPDYIPWTYHDFIENSPERAQYETGFVFKNLQGRIQGYILSNLEPNAQGVFRIRILHQPFKHVMDPDQAFKDFATQVSVALSQLWPDRYFTKLIIDVPVYNKEWRYMFQDLGVGQSLSFTQEMGSGKRTPALTLGFGKLSDYVVASVFSKTNKRFVDLMGDGRILLYDENMNLLREFSATQNDEVREIYFQGRSLVIEYTVSKRKLIYSAYSGDFRFATDIIDMEAIRTRPSTCHRYFL